LHSQELEMPPGALLRMTPAMAAGVESRLWSMADIIAFMDAREPAPKKRGSYRKISN